MKEERTPQGTLRKCIVVKQNHVYSLKRPVERGANMNPLPSEFLTLSIHLCTALFREIRQREGNGYMRNDFHDDEMENIH